MNELTLEILQRPFDKTEVQTRPGKGRSTLKYVTPDTVIRRLNEAFAGDWSFTVVKHEQIGEELIVLGRLEAQGIVKEQFGGKSVTVAKEGGAVISLVSDYKAAASDAFKKCATFMGVGLDLHGDDATTGGRAAPERPPASLADPKTIGDLKNAIVQTEKEVMQLKEMTRNAVRQEYQGDGSLEQDEESLHKYLAALQQVAGKKSEQG